MKNVKYEIKCDLCGRQVESKTDSLPDGWIKLLLDDQYEERKWHEKHICVDCLKDIDALRKGKASHP